jgi:hypothetical protein
MKILVDLKEHLPIESAILRARADAFCVIVGFASATLLREDESWEELRFTAELAHLSRGLALGWGAVPSRAAHEYPVQSVRRGSGPRRTGRGRYPRTERVQ